MDVGRAVRDKIEISTSVRDRIIVRLQKKDMGGLLYTKENYLPVKFRSCRYPLKKHFQSSTV